MEAVDRAAARDSVERAIAGIAARVEGSVGFTAVHLPGGRRLELNGHERYPMRSVYKLPIALSVLRAAETGRLRLDSVITVKPADFGPSHSPLRDGARGRAVSVTVDSLLTLMIADSDNTASDVLLRLVGGPEQVTLDLNAMGLNGVRVDRYERDLLRARDNDDDPRDTATPRAMADLLVLIHKGRTLSRPHHQRLLEIMRQTRTGPARIRGLLPPGTEVAHKTGTGAPMTNDAGLVALPAGAGHVAIVVFVEAASATNEEKERVIAEIARAVYDFFAQRAA